MSNPFVPPPPRPITQKAMQVILEATNLTRVQALFYRTTFQDLSFTYAAIVNRNSQINTPNPSVNYTTNYNIYEGYLPSVITYLFTLYLNIAYNLQGDSLLDQLCIYAYNTILILQEIQKSQAAQQEPFKTEINFLIGTSSSPSPLYLQFEKLLVPTPP